MKKYVLVLLALIIVLLSGCAAVPATSAPEPVSLSGDWSYDSEGFSFSGEVVGDEITLNLIAQDSTGLYWTGTFASEATDGEVITSDADTDALAVSLFGSSDPTKDFTFKDGKLTFEFTIMGTTSTVALSQK